MASILGIDVGGTFTDFVYYEPGLETLKVWKTLSTPGDPSVGIIRGIEAGQLSAIDYLRLGTTIATNAILERKGATVAFVTTAGFKEQSKPRVGIVRKEHTSIMMRKRGLG